MRYCRGAYFLRASSLKSAKRGGVPARVGVAVGAEFRPAPLRAHRLHAVGAHRSFALGAGRRLRRAGQVRISLERALPCAGAGARAARVGRLAGLAPARSLQMAWASSATAYSSRRRPSLIAMRDHVVNASGRRSAKSKALGKAWRAISRGRRTLRSETLLSGVAGACAPSPRQPNPATFRRASLMRSAHRPRDCARPAALSGRPRGPSASRTRRPVLEPPTPAR
jgi:hypothetical protein